MAIINQHPEWEAIASWFAGRAKTAGVSVHEHVEQVSVQPSISQGIADAAIGLAHRAGESINFEFKEQDLFGNEWRKQWVELREFVNKYFSR